MFTKSRIGIDLSCPLWSVYFASPFALRIASRAFSLAKYLTVSECGEDSTLSNSINAESKSGAAEMRCASDCDTSPAMKAGPNWLSATMSRRVVSGLLCSRLGVCVQGPGVWSVLFIIGFWFVVLWRGK